MDARSLAELLDNNSDERRRESHYIQHNYIDHANDEVPVEKVTTCKGGIKIPFPKRLHEVLEELEKDGYEPIVSWQPHGRCFVIHQPKLFEQVVMPKYFSQSKFSSFQRQLNLYGFNRITQGLDRGGYYHEYFLRGKRNLTRFIERRRVKGTVVRGRASPDREPNFYSMNFVGRDGRVMDQGQKNQEEANAALLQAVEKRNGMDSEFNSSLPSLHTFGSLEEAAAMSSDSDYEDDESYEPRCLLNQTTTTTQNALKSALELEDLELLMRRGSSSSEGEAKEGREDDHLQQQSLEDNQHDSMDFEGRQFFPI